MTPRSSKQLVCRSPAASDPRSRAGVFMTKE
jgi:hypothetical protein